MQEHIRRAHPNHYIPKLPATEESFLLMVNTPPDQRAQLSPPEPAPPRRRHGQFQGLYFLLILYLFSAALADRLYLQMWRIETFTLPTPVPRPLLELSMNLIQLRLLQQWLSLNYTIIA